MIITNRLVTTISCGVSNLLPEKNRVYNLCGVFSLKRNFVDRLSVYLSGSRLHPDQVGGGFLLGRG